RWASGHAASPRALECQRHALVGRRAEAILPSPGADILAAPPPSPNAAPLGAYTALVRRSSDTVDILTLEVALGLGRTAPQERGGLLVPLGHPSLQGGSDLLRAAAVTPGQRPRQLLNLGPLVLGQGPHMHRHLGTSCRD